MRRGALASALLVSVALSAPAMANESVTKLTSDPNNWAMQSGNYANHRYSTLDQINKDNVKNLKVAWTFSTGVLRGHEGGPLVIGNMMYVHTPFPNIVYALDLDKDAQIVWKYEPKQDPSVIPVMCCDTVNRGLAYADGTIFLHQADTTLVALDAKTGKEVWKAVNGDPKKGETTPRPAGRQGQGARRHLRRRVRRARPHDRLRPQDRQAGLARLFDGPGRGDPGRSGEDHELGKPVGKDSSLKTWNGDQWKIGGGSTWGWYSYDPELNLFYYGTGNPSTWNPAQRARP